MFFFMLPANISSGLKKWIWHTPSPTPKTNQLELKYIYSVYGCNKDIMGPRQKLETSLHRHCSSLYRFLSGRNFSYLAIEFRSYELVEVNSSHVNSCQSSGVIWRGQTHVARRERFVWRNWNKQRVPNIFIKLENNTEQWLPNKTYDVEYSGAFYFRLDCCAVRKHWDIHETCCHGLQWAITGRSWYSNTNPVCFDIDRDKIHMW